MNGNTKPHNQQLTVYDCAANQVAATHQKRERPPALTLLLALSLLLALYAPRPLTAAILNRAALHLCYIPDSRATLDGGFTLDGRYMTAAALPKLTNAANFGLTGVVPRSITPIALAATPITAAAIDEMDCHALLVGAFGAYNGTTIVGSALSSDELTAIKDWSMRQATNVVIVTQSEAEMAWGYTLHPGNVNPDTATAAGRTTLIFSGPFGELTAFNQGGGFQGYLTGGAGVALAIERNGNPVIVLDQATGDLVLADIGILTDQTLSAGAAIDPNNANDLLFANMWAYAMSLATTPKPDLTVAIGPPLPALQTGLISTLPITVTNRGAGPTTGPITTTIGLATGITAPATFTSNGNGCTTTDRTVICVHPGPLAAGGANLIHLSLAPEPAALGSTPTFTATTATATETVTDNNTVARAVDTAVVVGAGIEYALRYDDATKLYEVYMRSLTTLTNSLTLTAQVTIKAPHGEGIYRFAPTALASAMAGTEWRQAQRVDAPAAAPQFDYLAFRHIPTGTADAYTWRGGVEQVVFRFRNQGVCLGAIVLITADDPLAQPSDGSLATLGNTITIRGLPLRNSYVGNYDDGYALCDFAGADDDGDGILNGIEGTADTDGDGVVDFVDRDSDNDGLPDALEFAGAPHNGDTDSDGVPDYRDLDSDGDALSDLLEGGRGTLDLDYNGVADGPDSDGDGTVDQAAINRGAPPPPDSDSDATPDYLDRDSDDDGVFDLTDAGFALFDADHNGALDPTDDEDGDGLPNYVDTQDQRFGGLPNPLPDTDQDGVLDAVDPDDDGDGVPTRQELSTETDGDGTPNYRDPDDDGDAIPTREEDRNGDGNPQNDDSDNDSLPDYLDSNDDNDTTLTINEDANHNGDPRDDDSDGDGLADYLDPDSDGERRAAEVLYLPFVAFQR
jgi:hypothetical protein